MRNRLSIDARRRLAAWLTRFAGVVNLVSAFLPSESQRLHQLLEWFPLEVPQTATALTVAAGIALLVLAGRLRRGSRRALAIALWWLVPAAAFHLWKGLDFEEAVLVTLVAVTLFVWRDAFRVRSGPIPSRTVITATALGFGVAATAATVSISTSSEHLGFGTALLAEIERLVGVTKIPVPSHLDRTITPALGMLGALTALVLLWTALRPLAHRMPSSIHELRHVFGTGGGDSLSYFALRDDKQAFFHGASVVAYRVFGTVCLVSPDPVGPEGDRLDTWLAFRRFAGEHGWTVAVLAAAPRWCDIYRGVGMRTLYLGDEAVIDVAGYTLEGRPNKPVREAVNRLRRHGYRCEVLAPKDFTPALRSALLELIPQSRSGDRERGFSMTLGRLFDPDDPGVLVTVAFDPDGDPAGFCQFVPAPAITGYSLDVMRRGDGRHPNGVMDFVISETAEYLRDSGYRRLGLNFTVLRAVYKGEATGFAATRPVRRLVESLSDLARIEALYRFNDKFHPTWHPRYLAYETVGDLGRVAAAVARAESLWEIPLVGRLLTRQET